MLTIGVISDTHGLLRPQVTSQLAGVAHSVPPGCAFATGEVVFSAAGEERTCHWPSYCMNGAFHDGDMLDPHQFRGHLTEFFLALPGASRWSFRPTAVRALRQPWQVWASGVAGLCIYHNAYFFAIQSRPIKASLIAYLLRPLLIVVVAAFLPGDAFAHPLGRGAEIT